MPDVLIKLFTYLCEHVKVAWIVLIVLLGLCGAIAYSHAMDADVLHNQRVMSTDIRLLKDNDIRYEADINAIKTMLEETNENVRLLLKMELEKK